MRWPAEQRAGSGEQPWKRPRSPRFNRNTAIRVYVASPVIAEGRVVGGVLTARSPSTILAALYHKRWLLLQGTALVLGVVIAIALVAARTFVLPIRRLRQAAGAAGAARD